MIKLLEDTLLCHATEELLEANTTSLVAGADGCPAGWFVVIRDLGTGETSHHTVSGFAGLLDLCAWVKVLAVDIPIGLPDKARRDSCRWMARLRCFPPRPAEAFRPCRPITIPRRSCPSIIKPR